MILLAGNYISYSRVCQMKHDVDIFPALIMKISLYYITSNAGHVSDQGV